MIGPWFGEHLVAAVGLVKRIMHGGPYVTPNYKTNAVLRFHTDRTGSTRRFDWCKTDGCG